MIVIEIHNIRIRLTFLFFALIAVFLLFDSHGIALTVVAAAFAHETAHGLAFALVGSRPEEISLEFSGIRMIGGRRILSLGREYFVLAAGSGVNIITAVFMYLCGYERAAMLNMMTGLFNLLPMSSLDGGKMLTLALESRFSQYTARIAVKIISYALLIPVLAGGIYLAFGRNLTLLATGIYMTINNAE
ncbi:MAG: site-2 protease family protein [Oscillospiraceae bacterium]|nr:site-2 protease family protein [Oscillospiraceae bacterium]